MKYESWIWVELLAFDHAREDQGAVAYLERLGFIPYGISIMASASDFIMLHEPLKTEKNLFPDICTRFGHAGNEERSRQNWTNYQLRSLIKNLQLHGIKVFVSVFAAYHRNKFHNEWASNHPEVFIGYEDLGITDGINVLARLKDNTYYEDLFVTQLIRVMEDYGFDGWHGPDGLGPAGALYCSDCSDSFFAQFAEYLGSRLPADIELVTGNKVEKLKARMNYIWYHFNYEWCEFNKMRWESFWHKVVSAMQSLGRKTMINSANTKSAFESISLYGMDYRRIAEIGVDYLVVETVAANLSLISGGHERHFDFAATLAEMKAFVPEMKIIFLHGIKDVVESYDLLHHSPTRLEREFFTLANQYFYQPDSSLRRCADGFMACLGDGITTQEWKYLHEQWEMAYSFDPIRAGRLAWLFDDSAVDKLRYDYPVNGTWPGYKQISHLVENYDMQISSICLEGSIDIIDRPLIVPNYDLLSESIKQKILSHKSSPVILLGNFIHLNIPKTASAILCKINQNYTMACVILNGSLNSGISEIINSNTAAEFAFPKPSGSFDEKVDYLSIPDDFWNKSAVLIQSSLAVLDKDNDYKSCNVLNAGDGLRIMEMENSAGDLRLALISCVPTYITPEYCFNSNPEKVKKISGFPYTPLTIIDNSIVSGHNHSPLHIPPYGIIVMDICFNK